MGNIKKTFCRNFEDIFKMIPNGFTIVKNSILFYTITVTYLDWDSRRFLASTNK